MRKNLIAGFFVVAVLSIAPFALSQIQNVRSTGGQLQGVVADGVASFKGIPFAAPPVGDLRWKAPQPAKGWTGVKKADTYAPGCMQDPSMVKMVGASVSVSEDCLYLNVWTAAKTAGEKRPVMVWIHGGAFVYYHDHRTPASPDGANHAAEVSYVFGNSGGLGGTPSPEDLALSDLIRSYWINFARTGDPNGSGLPKWPAFTEKDQNVMYFDTVSSARPIPNMEKLKAFDAYYSWRREQAKKNGGQ